MYLAIDHILSLSGWDRGGGPRALWQDARSVLNTNTEAPKRRCLKDAVHELRAPVLGRDNIAPGVMMQYVAVVVGRIVQYSGTNAPPIAEMKQLRSQQRRHHPLGIETSPAVLGTRKSARYLDRINGVSERKRRACARKASTFCDQPDGRSFPTTLLARATMMNGKL